MAPRVVHREDFFGTANITEENQARDPQSLAERIRAAVGAQPVELPNGESITITASIGIAEVHPQPDDEDLKTMGDALIARADVALYAAKSAGRDRVVVEAA